MTKRLKPALVPDGGRAEPLGATARSGGVNFAVYSETASAIFVCLFDEDDHETARFELDGHEGAVHFGFISGIGPGQRYGLRAEGPFQPQNGLHFDPHKLLIDPYARQLDRVFAFDKALCLPRPIARDTGMLVPKAIVPEGGRHRAAARTSRRPRMIYEMNARGFSMRHPGVPEKLRGTVAALAAPAVIEHLNHIGADVVELMPVAAWLDEEHLAQTGLTNAWGYNPIAYLAPDPRLMPGGISDLRALTQVLRKAGISVVLDVVYNHTGEGPSHGPTVSLRGLDATTYYRYTQAPDGLRLVNDTGTGNTLRCDHPAVQRLVIDSMRAWVRDGGVDGFRFDLAPIMGRKDHGFDPHAPLLKAIRADEVLSGRLLIAEPWDVGPGGYQLGAFGRGFHEWNDRYRDDVRRFWRGDADAIGPFADRLSGSERIFHHGGRRPADSINFIAAHDGFTLTDMVSYAAKHNAANGEGNRDGHNENFAWNNGVEGETRDPGVIAARRRDVRALLATLFVSRGTPMLTAGDEMGRTRKGNNNAYAQDNEISWLDWAAADTDLIDFVAQLTAFRRRHPALTDDHFLTGRRHHHHGVRDVVWLSASGHEMQVPDWHDPKACVLGMHLFIEGNEVLVWFNRDQAAVKAVCPPSHGGRVWSLGFVSDPEAGALLRGGNVTLPKRSVVALIPSP